MTTFRERQQRLRALIRERQQAIFASRVKSDANIRIARPRYNRSGTITRSGGTPERPRNGRLANSAQRAGTRVSESGGAIVGQSRSDPGRLSTDLTALQDRVTQLAKAIPTRLITGDPNAQTPELLPNYLDDLVYATDSGTWYRWNIDATPAAEWQPLQQLYQGFAGVPAADVRIDGAAAINDTGVVYTGTIADGWAGATEDIDVVIDAGNDTYPIITSSSIAYTVRSITSSGTGTGTLSPTIDADIAIGGSLNLTLSGNDDSRWSATIRLQRKA